MPDHSRPKAVLIALSLAAIAGAGHAQTLVSAVPKTPAYSQAKPLDLSLPGALNYAGRAPALLPRGVARTSVERQADGVTGSAGLLCGLKPSADTSGAAAARGYDPDGKFVGARLALRF